MWSSNEKSGCAFLSFWLDPSSPLIKWYDPFAWSIKNQVIPFVCVYWFGVWIVVIPSSKLAFWTNGHPKMWDSLEGSTIDHNWLLFTAIHQHCLFFINSYLSSIITHKTHLFCLVESFYMSQDFFSKASVGKTQHLEISSTIFHQKETSLNVRQIWHSINFIPY